MNRYARVNYDASNKVFLNIAFIQLMSMTNQTDEMLTDYFNSRNSSYVLMLMTEAINLKVLLEITFKQLFP